jgi:hypothetical protein
MPEAEKFSRRLERDSGADILKRMRTAKRQRSLSIAEAKTLRPAFDAFKCTLVDSALRLPLKES